jgi:site-specific DNA recombinase
MTRHLAAVPDRPGRVVLYVRVSALMGRGGDDFHSPDVQLAAMRRATAGLREVDVIDDDIDVSGRTFDRDGIARIRALAEDGKIDALAVYNLARFGRNTLEGLKFLAWLTERGVTILSASEQVDTSTPSGRWMLTNLLAMAEMRSDEIGNEWSQTIRRRAQAGKHHGQVPTGYVRGEDGRLVTDPVVGPAIRQAFIDYADGENEVRAIRRRLRAATGLQVAASTFKAMMRRRTYLGIVRVSARGAAAAIEVEGAHPALVDGPTWQRVQERLAHDRYVPARLVDPTYSLSGIGRCGRCNGRTNHRPDTKTPGRVRIICVAQAQLMQCAGCGSASLADVEGAVLAKIAEHIAELRGDVGAQAARLAKAQRAGIDAATVRGELQATRRAMAKATERWAREQIDDRTYEDTMASLRSTEQGLAVTLAGLRSTAEVPDPAETVALGDRLLKLWPRMDGGQRSRALRDLVETVTIMPSERYRQPAEERVKVRWW